MAGKAQAQSAAAAEWRMYWPLVIAAMLGFSLHSVFTYSLGLFMEPLGQEFGWSRTMISAGTIVPTVFMVLFSPATGAFIDRHGSRRLAIPCIALTGVSLAAFAVISGSIIEWFALTAFYGIVSLGVKVTVWTTAITGAFVAARGLALGVTVCGSAFSQIFAPPVTQLLVDNLGWREAYVGLGLIWGVPCLILAVLFLGDSRDRNRTHAEEDNVDAPAAEALPGLSFAEALRSLPLIRIAASTFLTMLVGTAMLLHQVPILTSTGVTRGDAAWLASLAGVAGIAGKLLTGWLVDRFGGDWIGPIVLTLPALAYFLLLQHDSTIVMYVIAMMIVGYTTGAKLQICAYLTATYAGMRNYGKIFGIMASIIAASGSIGGISAGAAYDLFGNYDRILILGIITSFMCGALVFRLGAHPDWSGAQLQPAPQPA